MVFPAAGGFYSDRSVVPAVPLQAHAAGESMLFCQRLISGEQYRIPPVRMRDTALCRLCMADSILQCGYHQFFRHTPVHGYAGSLIPAQVHDAGWAEPAFIRWDVCNAAHHFQSGPISCKIPVRNIFCCWEFHNRRIDEQTVLKMHGLFCQNIEPEHAGRYRDVRGRITGSQVVYNI